MLVRWGKIVVYFGIYFNRFVFIKVKLNMKFCLNLFWGEVVRFYIVFIVNGKYFLVRLDYKVYIF